MRLFEARYLPDYYKIYGMSMHLIVLIGLNNEPIYALVNIILRRWSDMGS